MSDPVAGWQPGSAWLFCPADRPDRYPQALAAADVVIPNLEDAVAPGRKSAARLSLRQLAHDGILNLQRPVVRVTTFEGGMVDGPIFKQAERLLRLASMTGASAETTGPCEMEH